jgi:hypothetical protein
MKFNVGAFHAQVSATSGRNAKIGLSIHYKHTTTFRFGFGSANSRLGINCEFILQLLTPALSASASSAALPSAGEFGPWRVSADSHRRFLAGIRFRSLNGARVR